MVSLGYKMYRPTLGSKQWGTGRVPTAKGYRLLSGAFLAEVPDFPAEFGLESQHVVAVGGGGSEGSGLTQQQGGGGVVDEVVKVEGREGRVESGKVEGRAVRVGPGAYGGGVDDEEWAVVSV